jgi:hypothetical protein
MAKDIYHDAVRDALVNDGWEITDDPFRLAIGRRQAYVDLAARNLLTVQRAGREIAVEIKSFLSPSLLEDMYGAIGQYILYRLALETLPEPLPLYLAVSDATWNMLEEEQMTRYFEKLTFKILVFNPVTRHISEWID